MLRRLATSGNQRTTSPVFLLTIGLICHVWLCPCMHVCCMEVESYQAHCQQCRSVGDQRMIWHLGGWLYLQRSALVHTQSCNDQVIIAEWAWHRSNFAQHKHDWASTIWCPEVHNDRTGLCRTRKMYGHVSDQLQLTCSSRAFGRTTSSPCSLISTRCLWISTLSNAAYMTGVSL